MVKNHHMDKSIYDSSWNSFFQKLEYKAANAGILFAKVAPLEPAKVVLTVVEW
jgi:IS605 OrfB family transposase